MKIPFLILITLFSIIACTSEKLDQKEIAFYHRLIHDEKLGAQENLMRMRKWINERGPEQDLSYLIKSENLFAQVEALLNKNELAAVKKLL